ncbi:MULTISPECIES: hypothetical protein [unclassified Avibacterium]|uniref:hypothetical protein n=1 Tax=unclassified Avibacterium TaxID=2685287 RepID=UPI002025C9AB|nr:MULTISPECIES: hypothetical protein [unclassified Avibacterium]MCW9699525.1 hypothetical protein [Avibacterium sp. 20-129]MCW9733542.1 hypothetical protein [Avibacterium sp. 20-15]URL03400.1 hypothetical protein L4F93_07405 [Avibacterium sp. 20-132]URL06126.1 hypothetical protein L4F92_08630 [Avibacterium sp. 21-595]
MDTQKRPNLTDFIPVEYLKKALDKNDLSDIRSALMTILKNFSLPIETVLASIYYVYEKNNAVFEEAEESIYVSPISDDENDWNKNYFYQQQVFLNRNFTLERILHLLNVRETLMKKGDPDFQMSNRSQSSINRAEMSTTLKINTSESKGNNGSQTFNKTQSDIKRKENRKTANSLYEPKNNNDFIKTVCLIGGVVLVVATALFLYLKNGD